MVRRRESSSDSIRLGVNSARERRDQGERREEERKGKKGKKKKKERGKREKDCSGLFEFSKFEFIPFSYFRIKISFLHNFGRVFYF